MGAFRDKEILGKTEPGEIMNLPLANVLEMPWKCLKTIMKSLILGETEGRRKG